jgi:hypothetical protein
VAGQAKAPAFVEPRSRARFLLPETATMEPFEPDFELIKMDAEVASYQEDFDPDGDGRDAIEQTASGVSDDDAGS